MIIAIVLLYLNIHLFRLQNHHSADRLGSCLQGIILWNLYTFIITEILSVFYAVSFFPILVIWGILNILLLIILRRQYVLYSLTLSEIWNKCFKFSIPKITIGILFFGLLCCFIIVMSISTVPYNWDSMTYHLPRIAHWAQNQTVAHYATNIIRQLTSPVLAEFINLQVYILSGDNDIFLNLLQSISFIMNAAIVYGIARKITCNDTFCRLAALLFLTMPIAFSEALTTQVDHYATIWLLIFIYFLLDFTNTEKKITFCRDNVIQVCTLGFCVSLGYLAKPSVCIGMCIFVLWLLILCIRRKDRLIPILQLICCVIPTIILPLIPEMVRNLVTFQAISDPIAGRRQLIGTIQPLYVFINFLKNGIYNLPNIYFRDSSELLKRIVVKAAQLLHVDLDHPSISENGTAFYMHGAQDYGHDTAVNPVIVILLIICIFWFLLHKQKKSESRDYLGFCITSILSFIIFCSVLRWEPFVTRYMLSYLALLCPVVAILLQKLTDGQTQFGLRSSVLGIIWFVCIVDFIGLAYYHRNMYVRYGADERPYGYFANRTNEYQPYTELCDAIIEGNYKNIGIYLGSNDYEYPFWTMLQGEILQMKHVNVDNTSAIYAEEDFEPDCIIWIGSLPDNTFEYNGIIYSITLTAEENRYLLTQ